MKRLLVIAPDRALTRFVAEALLERSMDSPPKGTDVWDIARAHTPLEANILVSHGVRPFDIIVVDHDLDGADALLLLDELRASQSDHTLYLFLLTERGRDPHFRRLAIERHNITGFLDKPITAVRLRSELGALDRDRRILLTEPDAQRSKDYTSALEGAGYVVHLTSSGREALEQAPRFRPDVALVSLVLPDLKGLELCVALKRAQRGDGLPVILYGQAKALGTQGSEENVFRADDFLPAPFDDALLVDRVAALVGVGPRGDTPRHPRPESAPMGGPPSRSEQATLSEYPRVGEVEESTEPTGPAMFVPTVETTASESTTDDVEAAAAQETEDETPAPTPPPSASPAPKPPGRRSTRRVPCNTAMSIRNGARVYRSRTLDISRGGIFLATEEPLAVGERIDMAFKLPDAKRAIRAVGKVCWVRASEGEDAAGVGVKFSRIDADDLAAIVDYVNRVAKVLYSASE